MTKKVLCKIIAVVLMAALLGSGLSFVHTQPVYAELGQELPGENDDNAGEYDDNIGFTDIGDGSEMVITSSSLGNEAPLISQGKTVTAQDFTTGFPPQSAIDGNKTTYWSGGAYPRWWQIDLGENYNIERIIIRNFVDGTRHYKYNIQTSINGTTWTTVATKTNTNPATDNGDTYEISSLGRYVRVNVTFNSANTGSHISEFMVYGFKEFEPFLVTKGKTAEIEAEYFYSYEPIVRYEAVGHEAKYAIDDSNTTYATITPYQHFWEVDLEDNYDIKQVNIRNYVSGDRYYQYVIYISRDKFNWTQVAAKNNTNPATDAGDTYNITGAVGRYIRVMGTYNSDNRAFHISDFKAYGIREAQSVPEPITNRSAFDIIQSEDYDAVNSMSFTPSQDLKLEYRMGNDVDPASARTAGDYLRFNDIDFGTTGANQFIARVSTPDPQNAPLVSAGKPVTAPSYTTGYPPEKATDSDPSSYWSGGAYPRWWQIDLGELHYLQKIIIKNYADGTRYYKYNIQTSTDGINWLTIITKDNTNIATEAGDTYTTKRLGRYLRVNITYNSANTGTHISDFQVYAHSREIANLDVRLDSPTGPIVGTLPAFRQWKDASTLACDIENVTGVHDVYLVVGNNTQKGIGINWFQFAKKAELPAPVPKPAPLPAPVDGNYNVYFGNLHSHTGFSDGVDVPDVAYNYAKNTANIDFLAVTEHTNLIDSNFAWDKSLEWRDTQLSAVRNTTNGSFVGLTGSESTWYTGFGHMNIFNAPFFISQYDTTYNDVANYYNLIKQYPASINQWNHPWNDDFYGFTPYDADVDKVLYLMEVPARPRVGPSTESFYIRALDMGWHIAPSGNQDNHEADWGTYNTVRTAVLAKNLTQEHIYDAIRAYRVYSTTDVNMKVIYKINGNIMGSTLSSPSTLNFSVSAIDPDVGDNISRIEVYTDGGIQAGSADFSSNNVNWTSFSITNDTNKYYFLKVIQADGQYAITAPIWTGR